MNRKLLSTCPAIVLVVSLPALAQKPNPQETPKQYVSDLQKNPNDNALREKIARHVQITHVR